jgi:hypothetical protein
MSLTLLREAGFGIIRADLDDPFARGHFAILCKKIDKT